MSSSIRINKLLSQLGIASRRGADELIRRGLVAVNGKVLDAPGMSIDKDKDKVSVEGKEISLGRKESLYYYLLNKPAGYISTVSDTHQRRTIMQLIPNKRGLFPVGRLDKDTTGLLLITNDGELANRLMHPRYEIEKIYEVLIPDLVSRNDIDKLQQGVDIGEKSPSICKVLETKRVMSSTTIKLVLHEGKKRQIRRTFDKLGYKVKELSRIGYCQLEIDIKLGSYRRLTEGELSTLKNKVGLS